VLGEIGPPAAEAVPALIIMLKNEGIDGYPYGLPKMH
jgi:hypothetical protein